MVEEEIYNKAVETLKTAIEGKEVSPQVFAVSIEIMRIIFITIYNARVVNRKDDWADTIEE